MPLKRDPSLIPLSHDHHHGLVRVFEIHQALRAADDLQRQVETTREFYDRELAPHFRAEEEVLFPILLETRAVDDAVLQRLLGDHRALERHVASMAESTGQLAAFADLLAAHIRCEEREVFPEYQEHVPPARRDEVEAGIRRILGR